MRGASKQMRNDVDSGAQAVLGRAEEHLWECLNAKTAKTIVALKAAADAIAADGVDALKLRRRAYEKKQRPWNAVDFRAVLVDTADDSSLHTGGSCPRPPRWPDVGPPPLPPSPFYGPYMPTPSEAELRQPPALSRAGCRRMATRG